MSPVLEPAVVRPALGLLGRLVVAGGDPRPPHLELAHRFAVPGDLGCPRRRSTRSPRTGAGRPCIATRRTASPRRLAEVADVVGLVASGDVSVMPQPWTTVVAVPSGSRRSSRAAPRTRRRASRVQAREIPRARAPCRASRGSHPDRRHAGGDRHAVLLEVSSRDSGSRNGPGKTSLAPTIRQVYG